MHIYDARPCARHPSRQHAKAVRGGAEPAWPKGTATPHLVCAALLVNENALLTGCINYERCAYCVTTVAKGRSVHSQQRAAKAFVVESCVIVLRAASYIGCESMHGGVRHVRIRRAWASDECGHSRACALLFALDESMDRWTGCVPVRMNTNMQVSVCHSEIDKAQAHTPCSSGRMATRESTEDGADYRQWCKGLRAEWVRAEVTGGWMKNGACLQACSSTRTNAGNKIHLTINIAGVAGCVVCVAIAAHAAAFAAPSLCGARVTTYSCAGL
jgi:hypothetical protein